ncbi:helix-turn-helix transcriptional regulator [Flavobacterium sp.]|uniref:helix-turn-helix domain-containing protein n=1 Tax=Flavobacterium sp. TaxID=239 RepID=UPI0031D6A581
MNVLVGNKLRMLRKSKNMSQEEVADYLHISQSAYARMENGESGSWAIHILKISKIFVISPEELLIMDDERKDESSSGAVTQLSKKVIEQYEERIKELKKVIKDLKKRNDNKM